MDDTHLTETAKETESEPMSLEEFVGDALLSSDVRKLLCISRHQLKALVEDRHLFYVGKTQRLFPSWQFDLQRPAVHTITKDILDAFEEHLKKLDTLLVAGWAKSKQWEDLDGATPIDCIAEGRELAMVIESAHRCATWLGQ